VLSNVIKRAENELLRYAIWGVILHNIYGRETCSLTVNVLAHTYRAIEIIVGGKTFGPNKEGVMKGGIT
jgi:hypothetical protein